MGSVAAAFQGALILGSAGYLAWCLQLFLRGVFADRREARAAEPDRTLPPRALGPAARRGQVTSHALEEAPLTLDEEEAFLAITEALEPARPRGQEGADHA